MMNKWKKLMAAVCTATLILTMPGISVLANEVLGQELISDADVPQDTVDFASENDIDFSDTPTVESVEEDVVGNGGIQVGNGITATYNADTGAVEFTSQDGELWYDWSVKLGVDKSEIKSIEVVSGTVYLPPDSSYMFADCNMTSLDLSKFNTSNVTNMAYMFRDCSSLTALDLSGFDTSHVTNMLLMFDSCESLRELNLSGFNTSRITDMTYMFANCSSLTNLDLSSFNTSNVTTMAGLFSGCRSLKSLNWYP